VGEVEFGFAKDFGVVETGGFDVGVEDVEVVGFVDEKLFAVEGNFVAFDVGHDGVGLVAFVVEGDALQGQLRVRLVTGIEPAETLFRSLGLR